MTVKKRAVVVFNLGGPDEPEAIQPFLFNLFSDPAIISIPNPLRWAIAKIISSRRAPVAKEIYAKIGGRSPIVPETERQAEALRVNLDAKDYAWQHKVFISMRYWHPMANETAQNVAAFEPDEIVLLPLYPQYSITTTATGFDAWDKAAEKNQLSIPTRRITSYPDEPGWVQAQVNLISAALDKVLENDNNQDLRILFSAHGLPKKTVAKGDPYPEHVKIGVRAVMALLGDERADWQICYQSRVGPLEWIGPSLDEALEKAVVDNVGVLIVPIAFVSEHSETLVELDMEYRQIAADLGIKTYHRVPVVGIESSFINGLTDLVLSAAAEEKGH
jgi:protoporphyrin/coproporphyrin ferrochelatase